MSVYVRAESLYKIYKVADLEVVALQGLDLTVQQGELLGIVGASGSGKSTLLNILGGLDLPTAGRIVVGGKDLLRLHERELVRYRRDEVGFLWQQPGRNLLPYLSSADNVDLPLVIAGRSAKERKKRVYELLEVVGLADKSELRPDQLSGGEQQRLATAVALALDPRLLLADEPTGELDADTAAEMVDLLRSLCHGHGVTVVLVTHDVEVASCLDRVASIRDGRVSTETVQGTGQQAEEFVMVDAAGRLQIPAILVEDLGIRGRARIGRVDDHVAIWPVRDEAR